MFNFFKKKIYLKDLLEDFVDIHCHILPSIDDGAANMQESLDLIKGLRKLGIKEFIATPHIMQDFYPNNAETISKSYENLLESISSQTRRAIDINPAAEYMLDTHFETLLKEKHLFTLKKNYVLVELSYFQPPINLEELIFNIKMQGYIPVLAHPERYVYYSDNLGYYKRLKDLGCLFQLNLLSLSDHYGSTTEKTAQYLIANNLIDFAGTDTHRMEHIKKLAKITMDSKISEPLSKILEHTKCVFSVS
ncbi:tyrosine-protein phosphatase [Changchengzhania lutea]|uniref:tyrosine-protein phosphatase n=1 Tax=Changchengzhania lutea TaxID=2049305 RepID=UPI00115F0CDF|nr:CpsB/CapC family capsule biosynthesis tyrosine phosphatase [Changchengzhania lutea]